MRPLSGYPTFRHFVCLGRQPKTVRARAKRAGLTIVGQKKFVEMYQAAFPLNRLLQSGVWHDTVQYDLGPIWKIKDYRR